ncbi:hypothetical protein Ga0100231_001480 [Opitutaceae bacterium TAV4]|nr:hypothetical protein Ga0100231_001480 [Opitutaceae bacterium TAV4]
MPPTLTRSTTPSPSQQPPTPLPRSRPHSARFHPTNVSSLPSPPPPPATFALHAYRALAEALRTLAPTSAAQAPIWIRNTPETATDSHLDVGRSTLDVERSGRSPVPPPPPPPPPHFASPRFSLSSPRRLDPHRRSLLCDGIGDIVSIETDPDPTRATKLAYNILQGAGARVSKTEYVACPSCGRTLFDLQTTTQRIREKTGHLKGVKLAIMGCIVNGPGEMADADFGYVGGAPGKINLYVGKTCVQYNIPQAEADARLIALIKEHGKWQEPPSTHLATDSA